MKGSAARGLSGVVVSPPRRAVGIDRRVDCASQQPLRFPRAGGVLTGSGRGQSGRALRLARPPRPPRPAQWRAPRGVAGDGRGGACAASPARNRDPHPGPAPPTLPLPSFPSPQRRHRHFPPFLTSSSPRRPPPPPPPGLHCGGRPGEGVGSWLRAKAPCGPRGGRPGPGLGGVPRGRPVRGRRARPVPAHPTRSLPAPGGAQALPCPAFGVVFTPL